MNLKNVRSADNFSLHRLILLLACTLLLSVTWACGDETTGGKKKDDISAVDTPTLTVDPGSISFALVNIGDTDQQTLTISNTGNGVLRIRSIELIKNKPKNNNKFNPIGNWEPRELKPNEHFDITVEYAPVEELPDSGFIRVTSNDLTRGKLDIPIQTAQRHPEIFTPKTVRFERVNPGVPDFRIAIVKNVGRAALEINNIERTGHHTFSISFPDPNTPPHDSDPENDTDQWPAVVEPGDSFPMRIRFKPEDTEPTEGEIIFSTNDTQNPEYTVNLLGNSGAPCINVTDQNGIDFGQSFISRTSRRAITITNCSGSSQLTVSSIELTSDADGKFNIPPDSLPAALADGPLVIRPRESANFTLTYDPDDVVVDNGELLIRNDDPSNLALKIPVTGQGTHTKCPIAVAEARIQGEEDGQYTQDVLTARPLQKIEFSALQSSGEGQLTYQWTLLSRPASSQTRIFSNTIAEPELWLDLAGDYEIELVVYDAEGLASCEPSVIKLHVVPGAEIHIQLTWYSKAVPAPTDRYGTDLDLHYLHPLSPTGWNDLEFDIYWKNKVQNWGTAGSPSLAKLDIDDQWGITTENVNHRNPTPLNYRVGAHYFNDNNHGDAEATVRIYIQGELRAEFLDKPIKHRYFWEVARIEWPSGNIVPIDKIGCDKTFGAGFGVSIC